MDFNNNSAVSDQLTEDDQTYYRECFNIYNERVEWSFGKLIEIEERVKCRLCSSYYWREETNKIKTQLEEMKEQLSKFQQSVQKDQALDNQWEELMHLVETGIWNVAKLMRLLRRMS